MAIGIPINNAVPTIPAALLRVVFFSIALAITNTFRRKNMTIGIPNNNAVASIPAALGSIVSFIDRIALAIANIGWIINMTAWILLIELNAVPAIPAALGRVIKLTITLAIADTIGMDTALAIGIDFP